MNFGTGSNGIAKAWKDIWGCGQGIGAVTAILSTSDLVQKLTQEYEAAREKLASAAIEKS